MAVKNLQSVVCNVATQCGNVTNLDSKGYGMAMVMPPAMSSPQFPVLSCQAVQPGQRHERGTKSTIQAATSSGLLLQERWAGTTGYRGTLQSPGPGPRETSVSQGISAASPYLPPIRRTR